MTRAKPASHSSAPSNLIGAEIAIWLGEIAGLDRCSPRQAEPADIASLAASLASRGQIEALIVRRNPEGRYTLMDGRRRWLALLANAGGRLDDATRVRVRVFNGDDAEARALALANNFAREPLHPLDEAEAFATLAIASGRRGADVAAEHGLSLEALRRKIALANLSPGVRAAWREGRINLAGAEAFTVARVDEQEALLAATDVASLLRSPAEIRKRLTEGAIPLSAPIARFVGLAKYVSAGGEAIEDLFGGETRLADPKLVRMIADQELALAANALRVNEGWGFALWREDEGAGFDQVEPDFTDPEKRELAALDEALADGELTADAAELIHRDRDSLHRVASLRAVPKSLRYRHGVFVSYDSEGRLSIERGLIPAGVAAVGHPEDGPPAVPPPEGDDAAPGSEDGGERVRPRPLSSAFSSSASASGLPRRRFYVPALDAPLPAPARRVAELAASRAIAGVVLGSFRVALAVTIASCVVAERHRRPVRVEREHGPAGAPLEWLLDLGRLSFGEALAICLARVDADLAEAWAHVVASSIDCRGCDPYMTRELIVAVLGESPSPIAEHFDAAAFFREGSRATALLAIREIVGEARERAAERLDDSALEEEASRLARRAGWIPEFLRAKRKPASLAAPAGSKVEEIDA